MIYKLMLKNTVLLLLFTMISCGNCKKKSSSEFSNQYIKTILLPLMRGFIYSIRKQLLLKLALIIMIAYLPTFKGEKNRDCYESNWYFIQ